jgi:predicted CopG family antitoxin
MNLVSLGTLKPRAPYQEPKKRCMFSDAIKTHTIKREALLRIIALGIPNIEETRAMLKEIMRHERCMFRLNEMLEAKKARNKQ